MNKTVKITKVDGLRQTLNIKISSEIYKNYFENIAKDYKIFGYSSEIFIKPTSLRN